MNFAKTITMVEQTSYLELAEKVDVGSIINKKAFAAAHIYRMLLQLNVDSIKSFTVADADVLEYRVKHDSVFTRKVVQFRHRTMFHKVVGKSEAYHTSGNPLISQEF